MKVLLVNDYGTLAGGAEVIVFGLRDILRARGHDVRVFSSSAQESDEKPLADDLCFGTTGERRTHLQCMNLDAARELRRLTKRFNPEIIHVNLYLTQLSPFILRALRGIPSVYYAQWYRSICPLGTRRLQNGNNCTQRAGRACLDNTCVPRHFWPPLMGQMFLDQKWSQRFTRITAISKAVAERLATYGAPHLQHATVVHPGTNIVKPRAPDELSLTPRIITAGRLVPEKGVEVLIRAFSLIAARHPLARLVVIGDGPSRTDHEELAALLGLNKQIEFRGKLSHADTLVEIRRAWAVCVPSLWEEPFGMIAAEAQMHGVAVVASRVGGLCEILIDATTGHLVPPGDERSLADQLDRVCDEKLAMLRMGNYGHKRAAENFSMQAFADRFEALYDEVIWQHKHKRL